MTHITSQSLNPVITREKKNKGASFTIKSNASGKDYTYRVSRSKFKEKWYTHVEVETQYLVWKRLGCYFKGAIYNKGQKVTTPSAIAIGFVLDKVERGKFEWLDGKTKIYHLDSCLVCGATLTDSESLERGLGPICRS